MKSKFDHKTVEAKWQKVWEKQGLYTPDTNTTQDTFYNLWMFPYPSAEGLHAGHAFASTGSDVFGRYMRMHGKSVFQPIGYDSFGIHSENYAIKIGQTPEEMLERTTKNYEKQLRSLGHGYDWTRTVTTSSPDYYKWTQWLFTLCFKAGLAYRKEARVNWCPSCKTVLSDEQVIDGKCERCGTEVIYKNLTQWFLGITKYADRLLDNLDKINWPTPIKQSQRNWIGKAVGLSINFTVVGDHARHIPVWTRYWETIFGATFLVVSPEYLLAHLVESASTESIRYAEQAIQRSTEDRRTTREKSGVDTHIKVVNFATGKEIPVWVADYVIEGVGTGAVMGVAAHDTRDLEFAQKYNLPIVQVVSYGDQALNQSVKSGEKAHEEPGKLINSGEFDDLASDGDGKEKIKNWLIEKQVASLSTNYHLRDWLISRQRYWGAPIPMIYCEHCALEHKGEVTSADWSADGWYSVPEKDLPVLLPHISDYKPKGEGKGPLADYPEFYKTTCPGCGKDATRETDVFDTFMDSAWYFLRYPSVGLPNASDVAFDPTTTKKWLPVNLYFGGAEHSVLHLLYARFMTQVLYDQKIIEFEEPFPHFYAHGLMIKDGAKMSKSRGNVVNPDSYIEKFGADTMRLYLMFMGPMDGSPDFRDTGIEGMERFTNKVWDLLQTFGKQGLDEESMQAVVSKMHKTVKKVTFDMDQFHYNTALASIMEFVNTLKEVKNGEHREEWNAALVTLTKMLAPFAPHLAEEAWHDVFGNTSTIHTDQWPTYDETLTVSESVIVPVQVNGRVRAQLTMSAADATVEEKVVSAARSDEQVARWITGEPKKIIFVSGKLLNFVV